MHNSIVEYLNETYEQYRYAHKLAKKSFPEPEEDKNLFTPWFWMRSSTSMTVQQNT